MILVKSVRVADGDEVFDPHAAMTEEGVPVLAGKVADKPVVAEQNMPPIDPDSLDMSHFDK